MYINADGYVLIARNHWRGNSPAWSHGIRRYLVCRDNTFDYANDQVSLSSDRMLFENNTLTGHIVPGVTTNLHGLFTESWVGYNSWNRYIAHNTVRNVNFVPGNDGEAFALDSPGFYLFGDVRESAPEHTVIAEASRARSGSIGWNQEWQALVIKGRGLGQLRKVTGHAEQPGSAPVHRINVSPPWDVPPDRTSKVAIVRTQTGVVFEDNTVTDGCAGATQLYFCCYDCVAAGTVAERTLGVINYGVYVKNPVTPTRDRTAFMSFFTKVRGCRVSGASARFKNTWIGDRGEDGLADAPCFAPCIFGSEFRENTVDRTGCETKSDYDGRNPAGFCVSIQNGSTTGRSVVGSLFEDNLVRNSQYGYAINAPGCVGTLISRPKFEGTIVTPVLDHGTRTIVLARQKGT